MPMVFRGTDLDIKVVRYEGGIPPKPRINLYRWQYCLTDDPSWHHYIDLHG